MCGRKACSSRLLLVLALTALGACTGPVTDDVASGASAASVACGNAMQVTQAPAELRLVASPLPATDENIAAGRRLYQRDAHPVACAECHGDTGLGNGPIGVYLSPPAANFTCPEVVDTPDGQLYWVIRQGSNYLGDAAGGSDIKRPGRRPAGTAMRPHRFYLSEEETWQLVLYIRELAKGAGAGE